MWRFGAAWCANCLTISNMIRVGLARPATPGHDMANLPVELGQGQVIDQTIQRQYCRRLDMVTLPGLIKGHDLYLSYSKVPGIWAIQICHLAPIPHM